MVNTLLSTSTDFNRSTQQTWPNFRTEFPKVQQGKIFISLYKYIPKTLAFRSTAQQSVDLSALHFYL